MIILALAFTTLLADLNANLNIIYTNDMEGSVTTCGCATDPGGGVERRINWLKKQKLDTANTLYINAGNTLFSDLPTLPNEEKAETEGASLLNESMKLMKLDATVPGRSDFKKGLGVFNTASKGLPIVISNSDDPKFKKSIKLKKSGTEVLILGFIQPDLVDHKLMLELKLNDVEKALKDELKKISKKEKPFTIVLLYANETGLKSAVKKAKGVDLVLSAGIQEELPHAMNMDGVNVIRLLNGGDSIGLLKVKKESSGKYSYQNMIRFLGPDYTGRNTLSSRIKKYEKLKK